MNMAKGYRTYITALLTIAGFWGTYFAGMGTLEATVQMTAAAVMAIFLRMGVKDDRALTKAPLVLLAIVPLLFLGGCQPNKVDARALSGVMYPVLDRHDAYVQADDTLELVERSTALRSSELVRELVETALETGEAR